MPTQFDNIFRPLAKRLINDVFGTSATLVVESDSYNPTTGINTRTATNYSVKISPPAPVAERRLTDVVQAGDAVCLIAGEGLAVEPTTENKIVWDSKTWQIVQVNQIVSGDQKAAYELILRA